MGGIKVHLVAVILVVLTSVCCHQSVGLELVTYQTASYTNPVSSSEFTHFVTHNETGIVYVGASDALYHLREDFVSQQAVDTKVDCEDETTVMCPNYNKILLIDYTHDRLITCGSENLHENVAVRGTCNTRNLTNISHKIVSKIDQQVVSSGMLSTESIIAPGPEGREMLYVVNTPDIRPELINFVFPLSRRSLEGSLFSLDLNELGAFTKLEKTMYSSFVINYVSSFTIDKFVYFVTHQRQENELLGTAFDFISKINRVCQSTTDLSSFTEITLECHGQNGTVYNLIQAAHVGPAGPNLAASLGIDSGANVLYGVFAKSVNMNGYDPSTDSSLCMFNMEDIEAASFEAVAGCFGRDNSNSQDHQVKYLIRGADSCPGFPISDEQVRGQLCFPSSWEYAKGIVPLVSTAVIEWSDITPSSIITTTHRNHTIAFVGTRQGDMVKVHIVGKDIAREYERFSVGSHVLRDAEIDSNQEQLTILTKQQLIKFNVSKCDEYTTCDDCIGSNGVQDGDPYCGWCTLEKRCNQYDSCPMADVSTRWLPYNSGQCIGISNVAPFDSLPITVSEQQITLTVEQLPDLTSGNSYQCIFNNLPAVPAHKNDNELTCTTPAAADIPAIPAGSDHVTMALSIYSTDTSIKFVQTDFHFYECNFHIGCVACTNSSWACDWCIYSNKCTHDNGTCSIADDGSSIINGVNNPEMSQQKGSDQCPQLLAQNGEVLIPVDVSRDIRVVGSNLPDDDDRVVGYMCILNIEGTEVSMMAERSRNEFTCISRMYTYDAEVQELDVSLTVVWNENRRLDDIHGFKVTLYKCEVDRPDCSRCLSNSTARPELMCGWCKAGAMCTVTDNSQCSGNWISASGNDKCPAPILSGVWPPSGPHEGNTTISVTGTDLGRQFTDIILVTVGGKSCKTDGLSQEYITGNSISCRTLPSTTDSEEAIAVTVQGTDGKVQQSTGNVLFTYRDPSISSFEPIEGPAAGGTMVTIRGEYLDACSHISATIGSAECSINRTDDVINATTAMCRTTYAPVGISGLLQVYFDGAVRQSTDRFTYRPNPTVKDVQPLKTILSGGITLTVSGSGFNLAQTPQLILTAGDSEFMEDCDVLNNTMMKCKTPSTQSSVSRKKRAAMGEEASFGFIIADVSDLKTWSEDNNVTLETYEDPTYTKFNPNPQMKEGENLLIKGQNLDVASSRDDVTVYIGTELAYTVSITATVLTVQVPKDDPGRDCVNGNRTNQPCVVVYHGNLEFYIGTLQYPPPEPPPVLAIVVSLACVLLIIILVVVVFMIKRRVKGQKDDLDKLAIKMEELEKDIAEDIREAFAELQTDVTDLTSDLEGTGMPFVSHMQYVASMFFTGLETQPKTYDPELTHNEAEKALMEFSKLISNKQFLIAFIEILDASKSIPNRDKLTIGSLLTINMILENKLPYLTDVLFTKMLKLVEKADEEGKPNKVFQRTETITEKLLSNWIALSLYDFLKDHAAFPLFHLYRAIRCHTEKSPIDAITGKSHVSLNEDNIISERLSYKTLTLNVLVNDDDTNETKEVKVLDVDSIRQAKGKILDAIYRNKPYSSHAQPWQVDLEWHSGDSGHITLEELDVSSPIQTGWKKINTLKHFNVPDGATVKLTAKRNVPGSNKHSIPGDIDVSQSTSDYQTEEGMQLWHLVKQIDHYNTTVTVKRRKIDRSSRFVETVRGRKPAMEITFSRILGTKGTLQEYMDGMFAAILNNDNVPVGVKYIFDFFDGLAVKFDIEDDAVLHKWKSNILPLRFWQKIITNPQYIFDINQSISVERSLSVVSQAFHDAFLRNQDKLSKDASYRKLLYNQEIPQYRKMVEAYYSSISQMQQISKAKLDQDLMEISKKFSGLFSHLSTLLELYKLMIQYKDMLLKALEENEDYYETDLAEKLQQVIDIWDCDGGQQQHVYTQDAEKITEDE